MKKAITEYEEMSKHFADQLHTHYYGPETETSMGRTTVVGDSAAPVVPRIRRGG